jgi:hypothetical protein
MIRFYKFVIVAIVGATEALEYGAVLEYGEGISPRYFLGSPPSLMKRDGCSLGSHSCSEIGLEGCCLDTQYCFVDSTWTASCCDLQSLCTNPCQNISHYYCNTTTTVSGTASVASGCCQRPCVATSQYQCPSSFGAGCCGLGFTCTTSSSCISPLPTATTLLSIIPSGCTTGQIGCPASVGGGCCDIGATCVSSDAALLCSSSPNPTGLRTGEVFVGTSGLSTAAKAGIGAGLGIAACLALVGGLWFWMRQRKKSHRSVTPQTQSVDGAQEMSVSGASAARPERQRGVSGARGYFGPHATVGPYTEHSSGGTTPLRGVPVAPVTPGDIMPPVEIGSSKEHSKEHSNVTSPGEVNEVNTDYMSVAPESTEFRAELP